MGRETPRSRDDRAVGPPPWLVHCEEFLDGLHSGVLVLDGSGRVVFANAAARRLLGATSAPVIGARYDAPRLLGRAARTGGARPAEGDTPDSAALQPLAEALQAGEPVSGLRLGIDRGGAGRAYVSLDVVPLHSSLGGNIGAGLLLSDETEETARRSESEWLRRELDDARQRVEENLRLSEALNSIGDAIHSTLDFDVLLRRLIEDAAEAIGVDAAVMEVPDQGAWVPRVVHGLPEELVGRPFSAAEARHAGVAAEARAPVIIADVTRDDRFEGDAMHEFGMRAVLSVPLVVRTKVVAVLSFHNREEVEFGYDKVSFISKVATTASLAMENARVYEEERHIAETLQRALLAVPASVKGVSFAHLYRSATQAAWVGGDFFDIFALPGERVALVIGDVSGKGIEASSLASFTRQLLKAHASEGLSPSEVMGRTNELVLQVSEAQDFVTVFFGILSLPDGSLTFSSAGHPPPVLSRDGRGELLYDGGPILGAFDDLDYHEQCVQVEPGDLLVLYTDGVIEAKRGGELFGDERLLQLVDSLSGTDITALPEAMVREVSAFANGQLRDDVAVLCLRRL